MMEPMHDPIVVLIALGLGLWALREIGFIIMAILERVFFLGAYLRRRKRMRRRHTGPMAVPIKLKYDRSLSRRAGASMWDDTRSIP